MTNNRIKNLVVEGRMKEAFDALQQRTLSNPSLYNEILHLRGRFNELERQSRLGLASTAELNVQRNTIQHALLQFIDQLDDIPPTTEPSFAEGGNTRPIPPQPSPKPDSRWLKWLGIIATVVTITGYTIKELIDSAKPAQESPVHTLPQTDSAAVSPHADPAVVLPSKSNTKKPAASSGIPPGNGDPTPGTNPYYTPGRKTNIAFLPPQMAGLQGVIAPIREEFSRQSVGYTDGYFTPAFYSRFGNALSAMDPGSISRQSISGGIPCICQLKGEVQLEESELEGNTVVTARGNVTIYLLETATASLKSYILTERGAGVSREAAVESLERKIINHPKLKTLNLKNCK